MQMINKINTFFPEVTTHMGAGPCVAHPRVLQAMERPAISHLSADFLDLCQIVRGQLQYLLQTKNDFTIPFQGPASGALEAALTSILEPSDTILICQNGLYSERMAEIAKRLGANVVTVSHEWGEALDLNRIDAALKTNNNIKVVGYVHAETTTNRINDPIALQSIFNKYECLVLVDATGSILNQPVLTDAWGWDIVFTNAQKCLAAPSGLSPLSISNRAIQKIRTRKTQASSWMYDLNYLIDLWYEKSSISRPFHHNPPVNIMYGLHEALTLVQEQGIENIWKRHHTLGHILKNGLEAIGLEEHFAVPRENQIMNMTCYSNPKGLDDQKFRENLTLKHRLSISSGMGKLSGKVWRISTMGNIYLRDVLTCLTLIEFGLINAGVCKHESGTAIRSVENDIKKAMEEL